MQLKKSLSPALSLFCKGRGRRSFGQFGVTNGNTISAAKLFSFSPSEGEKAGKRGPFDCMDTAESGVFFAIDALRLFFR
jgi:hypothetical protein